MEDQFIKLPEGPLQPQLPTVEEQAPLKERKCNILIPEEAQNTIFIKENQFIEIY